jgi:hypothetical protein
MKKRKTAKANGRPARNPLARFRTLARNPNRHTQQGMGQLDAAMSRHGYVAPMTAAADGTILDGNARLETVATKFPDVEPIVVEHDGTRPIVMVRKDLKSADDPRARDIIVSANRIAEVDLDYDVDVLRDFVAEGLDLTPFEFDAKMLAEITGESEKRPVVVLRDVSGVEDARASKYAWVRTAVVLPVRELALGHAHLVRDRSLLAAGRLSDALQVLADSRHVRLSIPPRHIRRKPT